MVCMCGASSAFGRVCLFVSVCTSMKLNAAFFVVVGGNVCAVLLVRLFGFPYYILLVCMLCAQRFSGFVQLSSSSSLYRRHREFTHILCSQGTRSQCTYYICEYIYIHTHNCNGFFKTIHSTASKRGKKPIF